MAKILMVGAFDTKGPEYAFLREQILARGHEVLAMNTGVIGEASAFPVDIGADEVATAGGSSLGALREAADRGDARVARGGAEGMRFDGGFGRHFGLCRCEGRNADSVYR